MQPLRVIFCASLWHGLLSPSCGYRKRAEFTALEQLVEDAQLAVKERHNMALKETSEHSDLMKEKDTPLMKRLRNNRNKPKKQMKILHDTFRQLEEDNVISKKKVDKRLKRIRGNDKITEEEKKLYETLSDASEAGKVDFADFVWYVVLAKNEDKIAEAKKLDPSMDGPIGRLLKEDDATKQMETLKKQFDKLRYGIKDEANKDEEVKLDAVEDALKKKENDQINNLKTAEQKQKAQQQFDEALKEVKEIFDEIDASGDRTVTLPEFVWFVGKRMEKAIEEMERQKALEERETEKEKGGEQEGEDEEDEKAEGAGGDDDEEEKEEDDEDDDGNAAEEEPREVPLADGETTEVPTRPPNDDGEDVEEGQGPVAPGPAFDGSKLPRLGETTEADAEDDDDAEESAAEGEEDEENAEEEEGEEGVEEKEDDDGEDGDDDGQE
eukprot:TRINITY_DN4757_c0_g1_i1.p1 TRINITY_DN4757_c0_g1~~TRINITY_DN4757_c0_g1_i1.p1  ORF type:complete len:439 (+),score=154.28 TRINITY_DN4757_c0_g1_i1:79-1395(+)